MKKERGITLIALIITIIILLILAMVTIRILMNQGIIKHAENATEAYNDAQNNETEYLTYAEGEMDKYAGASGASESGGWTDNGDGSYTKDDVTVQIGDYVAYTYDTVADGYDLKAKYSGHTDDRIVKQPSTALKWRILSIDKNKVTLISASPTIGTVYFRGALGYNNAVYLLDDMCAKLYSNTALGVTARSLDIEDIEAQMNETGLSTRDNYANSNVDTGKYGGKITCTGSHSYYPNIYSQQKGNGVNSDNISATGKSESDSVYTAPTEESYTQATGATDADKKLTVQQTYYSMSALSDFKTAGFKNGTGDIIFTGNYFWLASRCVNCSSGVASFMLRAANSSALERL